MSDNALIFIPWKSVGIFKFDDEIKNYQTELSDWIFEPKNEYGTEHYHTQDDTRMIAVNKQQKIQSIFCYECLMYQGVNLIGLSINDFQP